MVTNATIIVIIKPAIINNDIMIFLLIGLIRLMFICSYYIINSYSLNEDEA